MNIQIVKSNKREHDVELLHDIYRLICIRVVLDMKHCTYVIIVTEFNTISYCYEWRKNMVAAGIVAYFGMRLRFAAVTV